MITPVLTFSLGSIPSRLFSLSTMPISSTNPATIPRWSIVSNLISELIMTSLPAGLDVALFFPWQPRQLAECGLGCIARMTDNS